MKAEMAKRMSGPKHEKTPPYTPRQKKVDDVYGKHGNKSKNLTYQKNKQFTKDSSNGRVYKGREVEGGFENN